MVVVDPSDLLGGHAAEVHHMRIVRAKGECLKLEEGLACGMSTQVLALAYSDEVLDADAVFVGAI